MTKKIIKYYENFIRDIDLQLSLTTYSPKERKQLEDLRNNQIIALAGVIRRGV